MLTEEEKEKIREELEQRDIAEKRSQEIAEEHIKYRLKKELPRTLKVTSMGILIVFTPVLISSILNSCGK